MKLNRDVKLAKSNVAIISIVGGFGNNLHQIAAAYWMQELGFKIRFEVSNLKRKQLEVLQIPELSDFVRPRILAISRFLPSVLGRRSGFAIFVLRHFLRIEPWIDTSSSGVLPEKIGTNYLVSGYWQRLEIAQRIPAFDFFTREVVFRKVAIHVRRGDMLSNILSPMDDYFRKCVNSILEENHSEDLAFFVYTDDPEYCRTELEIGVEFEVVDSSSTLDDFIGLVEAEYLILSRSTFSWWAGYFSRGNVYVPSRWNVEQDSQPSILPTSWIQISD